MTYFVASFRFQTSSSDKIHLTQTRFPRIYFDYICYDTLHSYLKTTAKISQVPVLFCYYVWLPLTDRQADRQKNDLLLYRKFYGCVKGNNLLVC